MDALLHQDAKKEDNAEKKVGLAESELECISGYFEKKGWPPGQTGRTKQRRQRASIIHGEPKRNRGMQDKNECYVGELVGEGAQPFPKKKGDSGRTEFVGTPQATLEEEEAVLLRGEKESLLGGGSKGGKPLKSSQ